MFCYSFTCFQNLKVKLKKILKENQNISQKISKRKSFLEKIKVEDLNNTLVSR